MYGSKSIELDDHRCNLVRSQRVYFSKSTHPDRQGRLAWSDNCLCHHFDPGNTLNSSIPKNPRKSARYHLDHAAHDAEHGHDESSFVAGEVIAAEVHDTETPQREEPTEGDLTSPEAEQAAPEAESQAGTTDSTATDLTPTAADDLTRIEGIGPKIAGLLNEAGITTYASLAQAEPGRLVEILKEAGPRFALADPSSWPEQAGYLAAGDLDQFAALSAKLKSGRRVA